MVLQSKNAAGGTTWRYLVDSPDDADPTTVMASGTVLFDDEGQLATTDPISVTMERNSVGSPTGASTPLTFDLVLADGNTIVTSLATQSILLPSQVDGLPPGTLESFSVGRDGTVFGIFSNSAVRTLAQVAVATFVNPSGLTAQGANLFAVSPNSGTAQVTTAGSGGSGSVVERSLELSNVDLSAEFINLISASTAYSANSRVITTTDQLFQQLLALGR